MAANIRSSVSVLHIGRQTTPNKLVDVQVTKDFVPVIYHDFLVSETGTDATMHTLSMAQVSLPSRCVKNKG
jgi:hypothetical protein